MQKLLLTALITCISLVVFAQKETIEGNGKMESRNVPVQSFTSIKISGIFELVLSQGSESVKIEADENLQQYFSIRNEGKTLVIDMEKLKDKNLKSSGKMKVYLSFNTLQKMDLKTIGNVTTTGSLNFKTLELNSEAIGNITLNLNAEKLVIKNKGVGNMNLSGKSENANVTNSGVGSFAASDMVVQTMDIENSGIGSANVNVVKSIQARSTGMGTVKNKGAAPLPKKQRTVVI